jgi:hypothetical protein
VASKRANWVHFREMSVSRQLERELMASAERIKSTLERTFNNMQVSG